MTLPNILLQAGRFGKPCVETAPLEYGRTWVPGSMHGGEASRDPAGPRYAEETGNGESSHTSGFASLQQLETPLLQ